MGLDCYLICLTSCRAKLGARGLVYRVLSDVGVNLDILASQFIHPFLFQLQQFSLLSSVDKYLSRIPRSMVKLNGFCRISAAPASRARFVTPGSWKAVMMITGISRVVAGFDFRRAVISSPVISGKHISIRIKSGCFSEAWFIAATPEPAWITS